MYVCDDMLGMLKLMLGAIVLYHTRVTPLLGAAHRPREARGTFKVNNPCPTRRKLTLGPEFNVKQLYAKSWAVWGLGVKR